MNKPILIFYFNSTNFPDNKDKYIDRLKKSILKNEEVLSYLICGDDIQTRIECINPKLVDGDEYIKIQDILDRTQKIVDNLIKDYENKK